MEQGKLRRRYCRWMVCRSRIICVPAIGSHYAIDMHVRMDGSISLHEAHEKATAIEQKLRDTFGEDTYISIHVEPENKFMEKNVVTLGASGFIGSF